MKLIVCVAENGGIAFNHRRQSRDEQVCKDMVELAEGRLCASAYSVPLFAGIDAVQICEDVSGLQDQYYFAERKMPEIKAADISEVVLYRWNREYPSDTFFDLDLSEYRLKDTREFSGKSHDCIRREIWTR
jgi:hypothetical protein